jgi:hypothetical protein
MITIGFRRAIDYLESVGYTVEDLLEDSSEKAILRVSKLVPFTENIYAILYVYSEGKPFSAASMPIFTPEQDELVYHATIAELIYAYVDVGIPWKAAIQIAELCVPKIAAY